LGDLIEHGNILARKIREEAREETGGPMTHKLHKAMRLREEAAAEASDPAIKEIVDSLLRRFGVRGKP
tara:strand:+ start:336 stop:539 length:204 start_codon:yes stop_codon:yes gene_type:complete